MCRLVYQEPAKKHAVHGPPCRAMDDDIIFRTNLALRRETAIVFPSKDPSASIFHVREGVIMIYLSSLVGVPRRRALPAAVFLHVTAEGV